MVIQNTKILSVIIFPILTGSIVMYREMLRPRPILLGLRRPGSDVGEWNGAWVGIVDKTGKVTGAFFEECKDYIGHPTDWVDLIRVYHVLKTLKWREMSVEDVQKTAGVSGADLGQSPGSAPIVSSIDPSAFGIPDRKTEEIAREFLRSASNVGKRGQTTRSEHETKTISTQTSSSPSKRPCLNHGDDTDRNEGSGGERT